MPAPRASELVQLHAAALEAAAAYSGRSVTELIGSLKAAEIPARLRRDNESFAAALVAMSGTKPRSADPKTVMEIESVDDPLLRDTGYRFHRLKQTPEEIAAGQGIRPITVRQNLRRLERNLPRTKFSQLVLQGNDAPLEQRSLKTALESPANSAAGGHIADAFACAAWESVKETVVGIGRRSVRPIRGRVWIDRSMPRAPSGQLQVAESSATYGHVRSFDVKKEDQGWEVRIAISDDGLAVSLTSGEGVVVDDANGAPIGVCTEDSPVLPIPGITLPAELKIRKLGTRI